LNVFGHYVRNSTLLPGQTRVTQAEFEAIALASVTELWTLFGNLTEIWFDGGYTSDMEAAIFALLNANQPNSIAMNGGGVSPNPLRWSGTEGFKPPSWPNLYMYSCSPQYWGPGCLRNASGAFFAPPGTDFTLQSGDVWFFEPGASLRSLDEMQQAYHFTVGAGATMELDFAIDRTGNVAPDHAALYKKFGDWIRGCYKGEFLATGVLAPGGASLTVSLGGDPLLGVEMDRVVLQEEMSALGQCVHGHTLEVQLAGGGGAWSPYAAADGALTIANKRIALGGALNATAVRLTVTGSMCEGPGVPHGGVNVSVQSPSACGVRRRTPVRLLYEPTGACLVSNVTSFPCWDISCPVWMGDCRDEGSLWTFEGGALSLFPAAVGPTVVNVDCNACEEGTLAKVLQGSGSPALFNLTDNGQLVYTNCAGAALCLNTGGGAARPACGGDPPFSGQLTVDKCGEAGTVGWALVPSA